MTVGRKGLSLSGVLSIADLNDGGIYELVSDGLDPGAVTWQRDQVTSKYTHGSYEVGAVLNDGGGSLVLAVKGDDQDDLEANQDALLAAFKQRTYNLTLTIDSTVRAWKCKRADYSVMYTGPWIDAEDNPGPIAVVTLAFPRSPIPVTGSY